MNYEGGRMNYEGGSNYMEEGGMTKEKVHQTSRLDGCIMRTISHFTIPISFFIITVLVFMLAKVAFMLVCHEGHDFQVGDVCDVLRHGLSLDLSTALYFLIVPFLIGMIRIWWKNKVLITILKVYSLLVSLAFSLAFVADTSLYPFWGFKLDSSCLQYLETPTEAAASVSKDYLFVRVLVFLIIAICIDLLYRSIFKSKQMPHTNLRSKIIATIIYVLFIPILIIGIRGGLGESTTNIGQVYYSQNQFLNHSAVNPVFSFLSSFEKSANYVPDYLFMEEDERAKLMENLFPTESIEPDSLLRTKRPNIVVILLESCAGIFTEDIGKRKDIMPRFNQLVHEGVYFSNFYANSWRTDRGTLCTWSGYPSFPRSSVMKMPSKTRFLPGLSKSLRNEGYNTYYIYGGDINFTNMRSYLVTIGFEQLHWMKNYSSEEQKTAKWGVRDDITFGTLLNTIKEQAPITHDSKQPPLLIGYSTLSSHEPWDVPTHKMEDEILNAFCYLDDCIGNFIDQVKQTPQWENLLVIMLPDHGISYKDVGETHEEHDHVPMLWLGGAIKEPRRIEQICNQTDVAATLLGQLGIAHRDFKFSRDVLSKNYTYPFAIHTYNNGITMRDSTGFAVFDLNSNRIIVNKSSNSQQLLKKGKAILQSAAMDLKTIEINH